MTSTHVARPFRPHRAWTDLLEDAAVEVFEIMVGSPLELVADPPGSPEGEYTAMVGLAGAVCGVLGVRCGRETASAIASAMLNGNVTSAAAVRDALGEICNMIAGCLKAKVPGLADGCMLSVPTVISGGDYELHPIDEGSHDQVCLSFRGAPLWVMLSLHE